jgi:hypothetical protein
MRLLATDHAGRQLPRYLFEYEAVFAFRPPELA